MAEENVEIARDVSEGWRAGDFHVWSFRGERVIRLECFRERGEALAAAGLGEKAMAQERD